MQYVGLGSLFTSILQVLSFAELGIGSALVFSMYKPIAEGDDDKVCALLNFYRKTYRVIGCVILIFGLVMMPFLQYLIAGELPNGINLQVLFLIYLLNNVLGYFLFAYKQSLFTASQRTDMMEMVVLFALYFFVHKWCDMLYVYQEACGIWWETKFVPFIAAIVNLTVNIILVKTIGLPGILISTIVSVVFICGLFYFVILIRIDVKFQG